MGTAGVPVNKNHGSYAQQGYGYCASFAALQAHPTIVGQAVRGGHRQGDLQHGQEGLLSLLYWRGASGLARHPPGEDDRREQDCAHSACARSGPISARGPALPHQEGCRRAQHLEKNRKDKDSKFRLILIESRIHRLARYYRLPKMLPANFKYESANAAALIV